MAARTLDGPVEITSLRDLVQEKIRDAIWNGRLKPGDRVIETQLARELGVSQAPVREALRDLEQKGFVVTYPRRGSFVTQPSGKSIREHYTLRVALEQFAARLVVGSVTDRQLGELERVVAGMRHAQAPDAVADLVRLDQQFHETFIGFSDHQLLIRTWANLQPVQWTYITIARSLAYDPELTARSHQEVVDAFRSRDVEVASRQLQSHIMRSLDDVVAQFGEG
jgi:DNA-binding GntR family transcriptional regulator